MTQHEDLAGNSAQLVAYAQARQCITVAKPISCIDAVNSMQNSCHCIASQVLVPECRLCSTAAVATPSYVDNSDGTDELTTEINGCEVYS